MSQKRAKEARRAAAFEGAKAPSKRPFWMSWKGGLVALAVAAVIGGTFVIPNLTGGNQTSAAPGHSARMSTPVGEGPAIGSAPQFAERNVVSGQTVSSRTVRGQKTLLFFSEGVMCQACLQQIRDIDEVGTEMARRHIKLVSITPDTPEGLKQAIGQYGITSPMISDNDHTMSEAFNTVGKGMHADTPGHAFVLIDGRGKVLWQRDYYQPPYRTMYVKPAQLLEDIPAT